MHIQPITSNFVRKQTFNKYQQNPQNMINFGVGEDYICDLDAPAPSSEEPGFKRGLFGILTALTFPISVPAMIMYEKYKDKHKDDYVKTDMDYDAIED